MPEKLTEKEWELLCWSCGCAERELKKDPSRANHAKRINAIFWKLQSFRDQLVAQPAKRILKNKTQ